jgi:hypothetical protein
MKEEQQLAEKIVHLLESGTQSIDAATVARLVAARKRAVAAMAGPDHVTMMRPVLAGLGRIVEFSHQGGIRFWLPVLLLLAMLSLTLTTRNNQPIDTDTLLLASDLPPEAYADKEFVSWLEHSS